MAGSKHVEGGSEQYADSAWQSSPEVIKQFLEQLPDYEQLCIEVAYILKKCIKSKGIEVAAVTNRAKTLKSFLEKIQRKQYDAPFTEVEDFGGVRVVCLYASDLEKIESIIQAEFDVVGKVDTFRDKKPDQFGYGAIHYVVRLGSNSSGARYDGLKTLKCEIQVRTVLQDAWAIIDHHLVYKRESDVPQQLQRKLNGLSAILENADGQFDIIRGEREEYIKELNKTTDSRPAFMSAEINRDSLLAYLQWRFPKYKHRPELFTGQLDWLLDAIKLTPYDIIESLDNAISPIDAYMNDVGPRLMSQSGAWCLSILLSVADKQFREKYRWSNEAKSKLEALHLKILERKSLDARPGQTQVS